MNKTNSNNVKIPGGKRIRFKTFKPQNNIKPQPIGPVTNKLANENKEKRNGKNLPLIAAKTPVKSSKAPLFAHGSRIRIAKNKLLQKNQIRPYKRTKLKLLYRPNLSPQLEFLKLADSEPKFNTYENRFQRMMSVQTPRSVSKQLPKAPQGALKIIPLGGLCEVGKNLTCYEYENEIIVVDVGVKFPTEDHPGIDSVLPNMQYLYDNKDKIKGIFITHGHEDHIGSIAWLMEKVKAPIFAGPLAIKLIEKKLKERNLTNACRDLHVCHSGETVIAGKFKVEYIHVNHSIADAFSLAIFTPAGTVIHSGDFKVDFTPINGQAIDLQRFAELGKEGVLLYMCESTNATKNGYTMSEKTIGRCFDDYFREAAGRIFVSTFSSNVDRVSQVISAAEAYNRKVCLLGRSMQSVFQAAFDLGYIKIKHNTLIDLKDIHKYKPQELCFIMTGSQGEPLAVLSRVAYSEHPAISIKEGDTIILSSSPIPGNERSVVSVIDELYKHGATVIYNQLNEVHVSGHASREELKLMHSIIKPRYFVPGHGEYHMLYEHAKLAHELGQPWNNIFIMHNGDVLSLKDDFAAITGYVPGNDVLIDGSTRTLANTKVIQERHTLADKGLIDLAFAVNELNGDLLGEAEIKTVGFIFETDKGIEHNFKEVISREIQAAKKSGKPLATFLTSDYFRQKLLAYLHKATGREAEIIISIVPVRLR